MKRNYNERQLLRSYYSEATTMEVIKNKLHGRAMVVIALRVVVTKVVIASLGVIALHLFELMNSQLAQRLLLASSWPFLAPSQLCFF